VAHRLILLSVLMAGIQVSACASSLPPPSAQIAVVAPSPATAAPTGPKGTSRAPAAAGNAVKLHLTYSERLLVPKGSEIGLTVRDANGTQIYAVKTATQRDAPPYLLEVPIKSRIAYPLKVDASLTSRIGHRFSESTEISESDASGRNAVEIRLQKE
jgi:hypothetical protein